ncbi:hypothetical protein [Kribbella sp. NPDC023855]|uniref:hypothetical protein n=1 Tax=Kribbella sp. NPDC023855 TaxID=3154698 RepID=UPI0033F8B1E0
MRDKRLVIFVATVAVAAVAVGGFLAATRGPHADAGTAAPLSAAGTSSAPKRIPPSTVKIDPKSLKPGAGPGVTYLRDRTVLGGTGAPVKVPGTAEIVAVGRLREAVLTIQVTSQRTSLVVLDASGKQIRQVAGIDSLVTSADGEAVAYASGGRFTPADQSGAGGTVYYQRSATEPAEKLVWPRVYELEVLAVVDRTVYFRSGATSEPWHLYQWKVGSPKPTLLSKVVSPTVVSRDGTLAAGLPVLNDSGMCAAVTPLPAGTQRWRTCQYNVTRFSPGKVFAAAIPPDFPLYGEPLTVALDLSTGNRLREWTGPSLRDSIAEDDDHLLLQWHDKDEPTSRSALVRCTVSTGACELASPLAAGPLVIGS